MIKQTIYFTTPAKLSLRYNQLVIDIVGEENTITRPIEDIGVIIVENPMVRLTIPLLNALTENNVAVILCNDKSMPTSMLMPLEANSTQQEVQRLQIEATQPTKKRLWQNIIEAKIRNQAAVLNHFGLDGDTLKPYYTHVLSGDSDNREGIAAKTYWRQLYGKNFTRNRDSNGPNPLLNYGYAILRAATARALLSSGLYPGFGLFHRNRYNAFPLADDIMEPYRPFVDLQVSEILGDNPDATLDKTTKLKLTRILFADVKLINQLHPLQIALTTKNERKKAATFRKDLIKDGFVMMQFSVYIRHCASMESIDVHKRRIKALMPLTGKVSMLAVTDKQFGNIETVFGKAAKREIRAPIELELF